ncbi:MAG: tRNA pseudouridine(55) synthase TruB [Pseudomonadales bacterium]
MARRRKGRPINGILLVDKPQGMSSNRVLQRAKGALFAQKAGHTGSLDPLATGVLPLCFGEATKFSQFLLDADKVYESTFVLGVKTNTGDADGEEIGRVDASALTEEQVAQALENFRGEIDQVPSMFSALKVNGQPLYKLARQGKEIERKSRRVTIFSLELLAFEAGSEATVDVRVHCSKGTYIRSIAEDLGELLGIGGHVARLERTASGPFVLDQCIALADLQEIAESKDYEQLDALLLPVDTAIKHLAKVELDEDSSYYLRLGQPVIAPHLPTEGLVRVNNTAGEFLGVGKILDDGRLAPSRLISGQLAEPDSM